MYLGGALLTATLVLLSLTLSQGGLFSLSSPAPLIIGIPAIGIAISFILLERRTIQPLLAGFLFQSRAFLAANLTQLLEGISFIIAIVTVPLMADTVMGKDPLTGALWLLRLTVFIPVGAILGGLLLSFTGVRPVTIAGLGFGLNNAPIMTRALGSVSQDYRATVASLVTVSRMIRMALGLAALTGWGVQEFQGLTAGLELPLPLEGETEQTLQARMDTYNTGLVDAGLSLFNKFFRVAGLVSLVAILPALLMRASRREQEETEKEEEKGAT